MKHRLKGRHYWLVGASSGIGRELGLELARRGARLTLSARSEDKLQALESEIGESAQAYPLDVTDPEAMDRAVAQMDELDGVIFLAAAYNPETKGERIPAERIRSTVMVNLTGAIYLVEAVKAKLLQSEDPVLALYASIAGYRGLPDGQPYSATKAGLINYAESLRTELRGKIDVKVINSGFVDTRLTEQNDFKMPMLMTSADAAQRVADGLEKKGFEILFPRCFGFMAKVMRYLPNGLFFWVSKRMVK